MSSVRRARVGLNPWVLTLLLALAMLPGSHPARASLPGGRLPAPELVSPDADATLYEGGLRFAWKAPSGAVRHLLLVSRAPFDARGWTSLPAGGPVQVYTLSHPVTSLEEVGIKLDRDARLYWSAGSDFGGKGGLSFGETRSCLVIRKFSNRVEPSPYLKASPIAAIEPETETSGDRIRLQSGYSIDPRLGEPALPASLREEAIQPAGKRTYLVYYGAADPEKTRGNILEAGGEVIAYIPDHSYLVRMSATSQLSLDSQVGWVGAYQPAYKLSRRLELDSTLPQTASVLLFEDGDLDGVRGFVQSLGGEIVVSSSNGINKLLRINLAGDGLTRLAQHPDVAWIEPYVRPTADNSIAQWVVQTGRIGTLNRRVWDMGIHGEGQVVTTSDTGIDVGHDMFRDPSVSITTFGDYPTHRKIIAYKLGSADPLVEFGDHLGAAYHGTHTACSIAGTDDGVSVDDRDGMAKYAKIYFMDISGTGLNNAVDPFPDLNDLFLPPYLGNAGGAARISSNSWGAAVMGDYDLNSQQVDQFMWNHPDFLIFFSNGNSGSSPNTVGSPASAKNSVGAGGTRNGSQSNQIYSATSRGPCADGRRKPTICAPAQGISSAYTAPSNYQSLSGTSMASPIMAGATALLRQYCTEGWYPTGAKVPTNGFTPSAALLKAMAVNSGDNDVTSFIAPDNNIGYGRIDCDSVLYFAGDQRRLLLVDYTAGLGHLQSIEYQVNVTDSAIPLEATLCWTDYPGDPIGSTQLVNNLNLTVTNGTLTYKGNVYSGGYSATGNVYDPYNVEEAVRIKTPSAGLWTIRIDGVNVPFGPQPFGLCITGGIGTNAGIVTLDRASYGSASTVEVQVTDTNAPASVSVSLSSPTEPAGETLTLSGSNGVYTGSLPLSPFAGNAGNGTLQVSNGDVITATYQDASPAATVTATARVSIAPPLITQVTTANQGGGDVVVQWTTNSNSTSKVYYGTTPSLGQSSALDPVAVLSHQVLLSGLTVGQTYYYDVESQDLNGNLTRDDNGTGHHVFTVRPVGDILLVYDGPGYERDVRYQTAFAGTGWTYDNWKGPLSSNPVVGDLTEGMRAYKVVWWQNGLENYPPFSDAARDALTLYLDGGGRLVTVGHDIGWANADPTSPFYSAERASWVQNTLHTSFLSDPPPPGWPVVTGIASDPISGAYTAGAPYGEHRSGASGDEIASVPGAGTANYTWLSGDVSPDYCGFRWESSGPLGTPGSGVWGGAKSRLVTMYFEWSGVEPAEDFSGIREDIMSKTLIWLLGRDKPSVAVTSPNGGETITADNASIGWTESTSGGTGVASRTLEYSVDDGQSWVTIASGVGASPYSWSLTSVPNTTRGRVRVRVADNGAPSFAGQDESDQVFAIQRANGDAVGPVVVAGSIQVSPDPVNNQAAATLTATVTDAGTGGADVAMAEWSFGATPAGAGVGHAMTGSYTSSTVAVSAALKTGSFSPGTWTLWVRGRDVHGNWGQAKGLPVVVNGPQPTDVSGTPRVFGLAQNAPNPVLESTTITFAVPEAGEVWLAIYDLQGRQVKSLFRGDLPAGVHTAAWNRIDEGGKRVDPGVYYYRLQAGGKTFERRMVALR